MLIFATQLANVATTVLAVFAIVTAVFAILAFRTQSQKVSGQASMLSVQSGQLAEQCTINALQAGDRRESVNERERLRRFAERGQAGGAGFAWWPVTYLS